MGEESLHLLRRVPLFAELSSDELQRIARAHELRHRRRVRRFRARLPPDDRQDRDDDKNGSFHVVLRYWTRDIRMMEIGGVSACLSAGCC